MANAEVAPLTVSQIQNRAVVERIAEVIRMASNVEPHDQTDTQLETDDTVSQASSTVRLLESRKAEMLVAVSDLEIAASGLVYAKDRRVNLASKRSDSLEAKTKDSSAKLTTIGSDVKTASDDLTQAQEVETLALRRHTALQGVALEVTADPLKALSTSLLEQLTYDQTGEVYAQVVAARDLLNILVEAEEGASILQVLIEELNNAIVDYEAAKLERVEKEGALNLQHNIEAKAVEDAQHLFDEIWDSERAAKRDTTLLEAITKILDLDTTKSQKLHALLVTLWLILSESKPKAADANANTPVKQPVIEGSVESN